MRNIQKINPISENMETQTERRIMIFSSSVIAYIIMDLLSIGLRAILLPALRHFFGPEIMMIAITIIHSVVFTIKSLLLFNVFIFFHVFQSQIQRLRLEEIRRLRRGGKKEFNNSNFDYLTLFDIF